MRKNILAKRILCLLALGGLSCNILSFAHAEEKTISNWNEFTNNLTKKNVNGYELYYLPGSKNQLTIDFDKAEQSFNSIKISGGYAEDNESAESNTLTIKNINLKKIGGIYAGLSENASANKNKLNIENANFTLSGGWIYGGATKADNTTAKENFVYVSNSDLDTSIYGGYSEGKSSTISNNTVILDNSSLAKGPYTGLQKNIYGGYAKKENSSVEYNKVIIKNDSHIYAQYSSPNSNPVHGNVYGGLGTYDSTIRYNTVTVNTSTIEAIIYGGYDPTTPSSVENNAVFIKNNSTVNDVYGGYSGTTANDNSVTITASTVTGDVYANFSINNRETKNGKIIIQGDSNLKEASLYGSNNSQSGFNNQLIINGWSGYVKKLSNFDVLKLEDVGFDSQITITSTEESDLSAAVLNVSYVKDDTIRDEGFKKDIVVLNNIKISNTSGFESTEFDVIKGTENGVHVNKMSVDSYYNQTNYNTTITAKVDKYILAGKYVSDSQAAGNGTLTLSDGFTTTASIIAGAYASGSNTATGGTLVIDGAYAAPNASDNLYAGYSESGAVNNNNIFLNGASIGEINLYAYNANATSLTGNSVTITGKDNAVNSLNGFDAINFNNIAWENAGTVLTIKNSDSKQESLAKTAVNLNSFSNASDIQANDSMLLIKGENLGVDLNNVHDSGFSAGVATIGTGNAEVTDEGLRYTVTKIEVNPQVNLIAENRAVAAAFVNQGSDLIADGLASLSDQYGYGFKTFAAVYGNRSSYDVSDDLKINGWSNIVGFGSTHKTSSGDFDWGIFYENGVGNYRTYNNFNSEFFRGDGNLLYNGGGVAARLRRDDGFYYEASLRAGTLKSEMSNVVKDGAGNFYGYESDSTYYGAHVGVGKVLDLGGDKELDVYGKYFHTYVDGDSFNIDGDKFTFDSVKSDRVRIGAQLTTNKNNKWSAVYGLAYEYEFSGDSDMRAAQFDLPTQSLEGGTVIGKIGLKFKDAAVSPWSLDLNLTGYQGQRDGFSGMVQATYNF